LGLFPAELFQQSGAEQQDRQWVPREPPDQGLSQVRLPEPLCQQECPAQRRRSARLERLERLDPLVQRGRLDRLVCRRNGDLCEVLLLEWECEKHVLSADRNFH
jgi:hypothetical protein